MKIKIIRMLSFNKFFSALAVMTISISSAVFAQTNDIELNAVKYFIEKQNTNDVIKDINVKTPKWTIDKPSDVYYLSYAMGEINLILDSIPNKTTLDSIQATHQHSADAFTKKALKTYVVKNKNGVKFDMTVYNKISYKKNQFVEFLLSNRKSKRNVWVFVRFTDSKPDKLYVKSLMYD